MPKYQFKLAIKRLPCIEYVTIDAEDIDRANEILEEKWESADIGPDSADDFEIISTKVVE